jgi:hypothetical protein
MITRQDIRTHLTAWLLLPIIAFGMAAAANYLLVCRRGVPLMLYLLLGFPFYATLSSWSCQVFTFDLAMWVIFYLQALWLPAIYLALKQMTRSSIAAVAIWGTATVGTAILLICQRIGNGD